jgi:hypothetical protein
MASPPPGQKLFREHGKQAPPAEKDAFWKNPALQRQSSTLSERFWELECAGHRVRKFW